MATFKDFINELKTLPLPELIEKYDFSDNLMVNEKIRDFEKDYPEFRGL